MNDLQKLRQRLAEDGREHTMEEMPAIMKRCEDLFKSVDYLDYMRYKALDEDDIRRMAKACGHSYHEAKEVVNMVLLIGELKYGEKDDAQ